MRADEGLLLQRKCDCGQHTIAGAECDACGKQRLQRRTTNQDERAEVPAVVHDVLRSPGQPLDASTRAFMEQRFQHDFSRVRLHTDERAATSARAVNASAYTVGRDVVFGAGQYAPQSSAGQRLLAHELAHVRQQANNFASGAGFNHLANLRIGPANGVLEHEADAASMTLDGITPGFGSASNILQRAPLNAEAPRAGGDSSTLPYREATELIKCIRIMGEENRDYCRQEVLGEQPQPIPGSEKAKGAAAAPKKVAAPAPSAPRTRPTQGRARQDECGKKCGGGELGSVECDLNEMGMPTNKVNKVINETNPCLRPCVDAHENVHVKDFEPICKQVHECLATAGEDITKQDKCLDKYQADALGRIAGQAGTECAAYKAEEACMKKRESEAACQTADGQARWSKHMTRTKCYQDCYCGK